MTEKKFRPKHLSPAEIRDGCITIANGDGVETRVCIAQEELRQGMDTISKYPKSVTMYGSARLNEGTPYYELARTIARRAVTELGFTVITGGGPGIMEGANRGAFEAHGNSVGLSIVLPHEQSTNQYVNIEVPFYYFFTRKTILSFSSRVYLAFPGGFGTFDEIFEVMTLIQTGKIPKIPIVLVGSDFWNPINNIVEISLDNKFHTISPNDKNIYQILDDVDQILEVIKNAPERNALELEDQISNGFHSETE